jgi:hypothetical protein
MIQAIASYQNYVLMTLSLLAGITACVLVM